MRQRPTYLLALALIVLTARAWGEAPAQFPANGAIDVNPDTHLVLEFSAPPKIGASGLIRVYDASDGSVVDTLDMSVPASPRPTGRSAQTTQAERVALGASTKMSDYQVNVVGGVEFHFFPIIVRGHRATIYLHNNKLAYGKTYRVRLDPGVLETASGDVVRIEGWSFTTKRAPPPAGAQRVTVAADGSGDFSTVQGGDRFRAIRSQAGADDRHCQWQL